MKNLVEVRKQLAEKGFEFTPGEIVYTANALEKLHRRLVKRPDPRDMTVWDKQELCRQAAGLGMEVSPIELDSIITILSQVREIEFTD